MPVRDLVLINPALYKKWAPPHQVERVFVYWNTGDWATVAGKHWRRITRVLPWHWGKGNEMAWGEMGHTGYTGKDKRFKQYQTDATPGLPKVSGHSDIFGPYVVPKWGPVIVRQIQY